MAGVPLRIGHETGHKRSFSWAIDWPGWCRGGRDLAAADGALLAAADRYRMVVVAAGLEAEWAYRESDTAELLVAESVPGSSGTEFGVPHVVAELDRLPVSSAEADRLSRLVGAAWTIFDGAVHVAPAELRKGPRGGGRDRDRIRSHVVEADGAYAREIGLGGAAPDPLDAAAVAAARAAVLAVLRSPSDGSPIAGRKWPPRYAARRIAWHALDHAWEIEDRSVGPHGA